MAAVQPFVSGAISKTVNLPNSATVEDVSDIYTPRLAARPEGDRDLPRRLQAHPAALDHRRLEVARQGGRPIRRAAAPVRRRLPDDRAAMTHKFSVGGQEGYITVGLYEDGTPGEVFVKMSKQGSTVSGLMDSVAIAWSMALQHGVPVESLISKYIDHRFEPSGFTGNPRIPMARSVVDYLARWMASRFLSEEDQRIAGVLPRGRPRRRSRRGRESPTTSSPSATSRSPPSPPRAPAARARARGSSSRAPARPAPRAAAPTSCGRAPASPAGPAAPPAGADSRRRRGRRRALPGAQPAPARARAAGAGPRAGRGLGRGRSCRPTRASTPFATPGVSTPSTPSWAIAPRADGTPVALAAPFVRVMAILAEGVPVRHGVEVTRAAARRRPGRRRAVATRRTREIPADLVVACDGVRSPVRAMAGIEARSRRCAESAHLSFMSPAVIDRSFALHYQSDGRQVGLLGWPTGRRAGGTSTARRAEAALRAGPRGVPRGVHPPAAPPPSPPSPPSPRLTSSSTGRSPRCAPSAGGCRGSW